MSHLFCLTSGFFEPLYMKLSDITKGYLWTLIGILAVSNVYIFSKVALNSIAIMQFGFYWFGFGLIWNIVFLNKRISIKKIKEAIQQSFKLYLVIGLLEIIATTSFFYAIMTIENPSVTSFLGNLSPIFVTILGVIILKERFNYIEIIGVFLTLSGAFIISFKSNTSLSQVFLNGTQYVLLSTSIFSINTIIVKKNIKKLTPSLLSLNRGVFIFVFSIFIMLVTKQDIHIPKDALLAITIGSLLGPFLTVIAGYNALQYIEASKRSILSSSKSLFVLLGAYLYFGKFPMEYQIIGGVFTVFGVLLISFGKLILKKRKH